MRHFSVRQQGFTLIEILAVVIIIGLAVSVIALSVGGTRDENVTRKEAQLFMQSLEFAGEQAVLNGDTLGMFVVPKDGDEPLSQKWCYHWQRFRDEAWQDLPDDLLSEHCMPDNMQWDITIEDKIYDYDPDLETQLPVLVLSPSGESTPIEMSIFENAKKITSSDGVLSETQRIEIDMMGGIRWLNQEEEDERDKKR